MADRYYFDTYALVGKLNAAPAYQRFEGVPIFAHQMNVYELVAALLRDHPETRVREAVRLLAVNPLKAETDDLFAASRFRAEHAGKRVSYVDALGYVLARKHGLRFLTGDTAFKGAENVEYVP